jgi:hypothetical protein
MRSDWEVRTSTPAAERFSLARTALGFWLIAISMHFSRVRGSPETSMQNAKCKISRLKINNFKIFIAN